MSANDDNSNKNVTVINPSLLAENETIPLDGYSFIMGNVEFCYTEDGEIYVLEITE